MSDAIRLITAVAMLGIIVAASAGLVVVVAPFVRMPHFGRRPASASKHDGTCERCGHGVAAGLPRCARCGRITAVGRRERLRALWDRWPTAIRVRLPLADESLTEVFVTDDDAIAALLAEQLRAHGVAAQVVAPPPHNRYRASGSHRVVVWSGDVDRARGLVSHLWPDDDGQPVPPDDGVPVPVVSLTYAGPRAGREV